MRIHGLTQMLLVICLPAMMVCTPTAEEADTVLLMTYFTGNGEDGLHFATSEDGLAWRAVRGGASFLEPKVGGAKLMRDPCLIQGPAGRFHMVWTTGWWENNIGIAHSDVLIHWSEQQAIPVMAHEPEVRNCWAPEIFYDQENERYLIFWASTIPGRFPETADSGDNGLNHRMYYVTTQDFESYSEAALFYDPGFNVIDSTLLQRGPGDYVMFLKNETRHPPEKNIRLAYAESAAGPYGPASEPITGDYWAEGPTAIMIGEMAYVYFDRYRQGRYGAVRSADFENWEDISDALRTPEGMRHGTILRVDRSVVENLENP